MLGAAVLFLGLAAGYAFFGGDSGRSSGSTVDVGFLQDMRAHHDQAVSMAFTYLEKPAGEQDPVLRSIAKTIIADQQFENGYMVGLLLDMGADPANETGQAMAWMDQPVPLERMPGMATEAQLDELQAATGPEADALFVELMTAHHEGGIHMAEHAAEHGGRADVRSLAERMAANQRGEIVDLRNALARARAEPRPRRAPEVARTPFVSTKTALGGRRHKRSAFRIGSPQALTPACVAISSSTSSRPPSSGAPPSPRRDPVGSRPTRLPAVRHRPLGAARRADVPVAGARRPGAVAAGRSSRPRHGAVVSHRSAAVLHGFDGFPSGPLGTVPRARRSPASPCACTRPSRWA